MIVSVLGLGYIGLPTAAILASKAVTVVGVDVNQKTVDTINQGKIHIVEPGLDVLVKSAVQNKYLKAVTRPEKADVFIIAVPTPLKSNNLADLSYIKTAAKLIAPVLERGNLVILESTSPVNTTEKLIEWMREERSDVSFPIFKDDEFAADIAVAHCPERVLPGNVIRELVKNDRIIGGVSAACAQRALKLYNIFVEADCLITDCRTAELSKLVENSFRDVNIAFANELSLICDKLGINVWNLIELANRHPRVNILQPGPGVGGHCIAVDPWFIVESSPEEAILIRTARLVNDSKPSFVLDKVNKAVKTTRKNISELSIACLGLAFKPNIDDLRESPALSISQMIASMGFSSTFLVEPNINCIPNHFIGKDFRLVDLEKAIYAADIVVLLVDHTPFKSMDLSLLTGKQIIDTRGIWL
jgi:UDP-N-acetyl-D-mannosaminuronic acid dehydrogenase